MTLPHGGPKALPHGGSKNNNKDIRKPSKYGSSTSLKHGGSKNLLNRGSTTSQAFSKTLLQNHYSMCLFQNKVPKSFPEVPKTTHDGLRDHPPAAPDEFAPPGGSATPFLLIPGISPRKAISPPLSSVGVCVVGESAGDYVVGESVGVGATLGDCVEDGVRYGVVDATPHCL